MRPWLLALLLFLLACAPNQDPLDPQTPSPAIPSPQTEGLPEVGVPSPPSGATEDNTAASRDMVPRLFPTAVHVVPKKMDGAEAPAMVASDAQQKLIGVVWQTPVAGGGTLVLGVYPDATVVGVEVLGSPEKAVEDAEFLSQFIGKSPDELADPSELKPAVGAEAASRTVWQAVGAAVQRLKGTLQEQGAAARPLP